VGISAGENVRAVVLYGDERGLIMGLQEEWKVLRAEADEDSTPLDLTTKGDYDQMPSGGIEIEMPAALLKVPMHLAVIACAGAAQGKTFTVTYYGAAVQNGPSQVLCVVDYTTGTQAVVKYPHNKETATNKFWADTAVVTERWANGITVGDGDGNNGIAEVRIPYIRGLGRVFAQVSAADGATGNEAGDVTIYHRLYTS